MEQFLKLEEVKLKKNFNFGVYIQCSFRHILRKSIDVNINLVFCKKLNLLENVIMKIKLLADDIMVKSPESLKRNHRTISVGIVYITNKIFVTNWN